MKKNNSGISAVPLIFALVLLISLGAFFISLMLGKHIGAPLLAQSTKALYITDAGIEFTAIYLRGFANDADWTDGISDIPSTSFGDGNFAVTFTNTPNSVTATSIGTISNARRDISTKFTRLAVLMSNPVNWVSKIEIDVNVTVNSTCSPCKEPETDPSKRCSIISPACATEVTLTQAPPPELPANAPPLQQWLNWSGGNAISGNYTFAAGTYYFDKLELKDNAHVTVSGPVTIWIWDKFEMKDNSQFNWGGIAANLLLLSAGGPEDPEPDFEIEDEAMFRGAIYGPQPGVEIEIIGKNSTDKVLVNGTITGYDVKKLKDTTITLAPDDKPGVNAMIKASGWGEK